MKENTWVVAVLDRSRSGGNGWAWASANRFNNLARASCFGIDYEKALNPVARIANVRPTLCGRSTMDSVAVSEAVDPGSTPGARTNSLSM